MSIFEKTVIFIPSLDPDHKLYDVVKNLVAEGFIHVVVLNDGSKSDEIFTRIENDFNCDILKHCVNLGKGRALKDGLNYIYNTYPECLGVVTVDGDGQHLSKDTIKVAKAMADNPGELIMGCRDFSSDNVPARSKFGNLTTSRVMKLLCGIKLSDTQTGLRGIAMSLVPDFVKISGERFEYELNMILECKNLEIPLREVTIDTVYIEENTSSHFNPILDSIRIYSLFFKFVFSSLSSSLLDLVLFSLFCSLFSKNEMLDSIYIPVCTVCARVISAAFNYTINRSKVFKNKNSIGKSSVRYAVLAIVNCAASAGFVYLLFDICKINATLIKVAVDTILFMISFHLQREWVFKK